MHTAVCNGFFSPLKNTNEPMKMTWHCLIYWVQGKTQFVHKYGIHYFHCTAVHLHFYSSVSLYIYIF